MVCRLYDEEVARTNTVPQEPVNASCLGGKRICGSELQLTFVDKSMKTGIGGFFAVEKGYANLTSERRQGGEIASYG